MEAAPFDAEVVAGALQNARRGRADRHAGHAGRVALPARRDRRVAGLVEAELLRGGEAGDDLVGAAVGAFGAHVDERDRAGERREVVREERRREGDGQADAGALEDGRRRKEPDRERNLLQGALRPAAEEAPGGAVDDGDAAEEVGDAGPVDGVLGGQAVGRAPEAEVGVDGGEGDGGSAHEGGMLGLAEAFVQSWRTKPLSAASTTRLSRSLKSWMPSRMPPQRNHTVEMQPTIIGMMRLVM